MVSALAPTEGENVLATSCTGSWQGEGGGARHATADTFQTDLPNCTRMG